MKGFSPLLSHWHGQVKQLFTLLHGHQKKVLALFVLEPSKPKASWWPGWPRNCSQKPRPKFPVLNGACNVF